MNYFISIHLASFTIYKQLNRGKINLRISKLCGVITSSQYFAKTDGKEDFSLKKNKMKYRHIRNEYSVVHIAMLHNVIHVNLVNYMYRVL